MLCYGESRAGLPGPAAVRASASSAAHEAAGQVHGILAALGLDGARPYPVTDLLHNQSYTWSGGTNSVALRPNGVSMHAFLVTRSGAPAGQLPGWPAASGFMRNMRCSTAAVTPERAASGLGCERE